MPLPVNRATAIEAQSRIFEMEQAITRLKASMGANRLTVTEANQLGTTIRTSLYDLTDLEGEFSDHFLDRTKP